MTYLENDLHFLNLCTIPDEKIATNILTDRLKKLRSQHIIDFRLNDKNKKIKEYYLTDRGVELYDIIYQLQYWTLQNVNFTFSENTKKWKKLSEELPREKVIEQYKQSYKEFRKKKENESRKNATAFI